ncbi:MAG: hypothetical protein MI922_08465 [Bacteroidales bacterium]|nr:hypothetical protein [Bacteroidales bacterium]
MQTLRGKSHIIQSKIILSCFACVLLLVSCSSESLIQGKKRNVVATINDEEVELYSITHSSQMENYNTNYKQLEHYINNKILAMEAKKRRMPLNTLLQLEVENKTVPTHVFKSNTLLSYHSSNYTMAQILNIERKMKKRERMIFYIDSLKKHSYKVNIHINESPVNFREKLCYSDEYWGKGKNKLYIISECYDEDFKNMLNEILIIQSRTNNVKLFHIPYTDAPSLKSLALEAAIAQNKYKDFLFHSYNTGMNDNDSATIYSIAQKAKLNLKKFDKAIKDEKLQDNIAKRKSFFHDLKIYSTPRYILNDKLLPDTVSLGNVIRMANNTKHLASLY